MRHLFIKGEYQCFNTELLDFNWDRAFDDILVEVMWSIFHAKYVDLSNKYVPTQCCSGLTATPQWMNTTVLAAIKRKRM